MPESEGMLGPDLMALKFTCLVVIARFSLDGLGCSGDFPRRIVSGGVDSDSRSVPSGGSKRALRSLTFSWQDLDEHLMIAAQLKWSMGQVSWSFGDKGVASDRFFFIPALVLILVLMATAHFDSCRPT